MKIFDDIDDTQAEILKYYINREKPFGPENAGAVKEPIARWILFNQHNAICAEFRKDPNIIIGRRGSGKTSMVSNTDKVDKHTYIINTSPYDLINYIRQEVHNTNNANCHFVENISRYWDVLLNTLLMAQVSTKILPNELGSVRRFLATSEIDAGSNLTGIIAALRKNAPKVSGAGGLVVGTLIDFIDGKKGFYDEALSAINEHFDKNKQNSVIIIDSLEDYKLDDALNQQVIGGLLKCAGDYGDRYRQIRLCIPGESYFDIRACSSNPLKDFTKNLLLQWLPSELFSIIAWKYTIYCRLYDAQKYNQLRDGDFTQRQFILSIVDMLFNQRVINSLGISEPTLPYIMRHTQLLPRQMILVLNRIFGRSDNESGDIKIADDQMIVNAIKYCEGTLCEEIFTAFKYKYPYAKFYCQKCVPELPRIFRHGHLLQTYNRHARNKKGSNPDLMEFDELKRCLIEMGIIGRIRNKTDIYANGEFEYAQPSGLTMSVDDEICLHPIFSGTFESAKNKEIGLVVYPQRDLVDTDTGRNLRVRA